MPFSSVSMRVVYKYVWVCTSMFVYVLVCTTAILGEATAYGGRGVGEDYAG